MYRSALTVLTVVFLGCGVPPATAADANKPVGITPDVASVEVTHNGETVSISRNPDNANTVKADYAITSRGHRGVPIHTNDHIQNNRPTTNLAILNVALLRY